MSERTRRSMLKAMAAVPVAGALWPGRALAQTVTPFRKGDSDRLRIASVVLSPPIATLGSTVAVTVTVHNPSDRAISSIPWELTFGPKQTLRGSLAIPANSSATFTGSFTANRLMKIPVVAAVDPGNTLAEPVAVLANNRVETSVVVQAATADQWSGWSQIAAQDAQVVLEELTRTTSIGWSMINGPDLKFKLRCVVLATGTQHSLALTQKGLPAAVARAFVECTIRAYEAWVAGFQGQHPGAYPSFVALPSPQAPPTPNVPLVISAAGTSPGAAQFSQTTLAAAVKLQLGAKASEPGAGPAIDAFAQAVSFRFSLLLVTKHLQNALGTGPVPTFAPPYVPSGPVVAGTVVPATCHLF